jgi:hypothetical protein
LGVPDLGHVAAREALRLAALAPDPLRAAAVRYTLGHVLMRQGRFLDAERVAVATAEDVQPTGQASPEQLSVYGDCCCGVPRWRLGSVGQVRPPICWLRRPRATRRCRWRPSVGTWLMSRTRSCA